jgi:hypothetical protein
VIGANDAALERRLEVFHAVRVDFNAHIFAFAMPNDLMEVESLFSFRHRLDAHPRKQADISGYGFVNEAVQGLALRVLNHAADHVTLAGDRAVSPLRLEG